MTATVPIRGTSTATTSRSGLARPTAGEEVQAGVSQGTPKIVTAFLISLLIPFIIEIGEIALQPHRIVILATMPYLLIRLASGRAGKITSVDILIFLAAFWCLFAYSIVTSNFLRSALATRLQFAFSFFFEMYGGFLIARVGIQSANDLRRVARFLFYFALVALPLAAVEAISHKAFLMDLLGRIPAYDVRFGMRRAQMVFGHPILYGTFVSSAMGLVWYTFRPNSTLISQIGRSVFVFTALFFSFSMGAIMSFLVQTGSIVYERLFKDIPKRWTLLFAGIAAAYLAVDLVAKSSPFAVFVRYLTFNQQASYTRIKQFEAGIDNIMSRPILGFGSGTWDKPIGWVTGSIDNFWLLSAMQFGLPAFLFLSIGLFILLRKLSLKPLSDELDRASRAAVLTSMGGIIFAGATVHYWQGMLAFVMFIFGSGVWILSRPDQVSSDLNIDPEADTTSPEKPPPASGKKQYVPYGREG
jgi:hypothetical protein